VKSMLHLKTFSHDRALLCGDQADTLESPPLILDIRDETTAQDVATAGSITVRA